MRRRSRVHKVGLTAAAFGLPALLVLPFATLRASRIQTGEDLSIGAVLPTVLIGVLVGGWLVLVALSLRSGRDRRLAAGRGLAASAIIVAMVGFSGLAATQLLSEAGEFARVSIGVGVWVSVFAAYTVVFASRREVGTASTLSWAIVLSAPAGLVALGLAGVLSDLGVAVEYRNLGDRYWAEVGRHVTYSVAAIVAAVLLGVTLGILAYRYRRLERPVFAVVNLFQTIPGLAMIGLLVVPLAQLSFALPFLRTLGIGGLGWAPVVLSLTLYALLAIVRNTYAGLASIPLDTIEAGYGMGMTPRQVLARVQLPLARPVVFSGVRVSSQQTVGNATLGAFAAAGTLGLFIFQGLAQQSTDLVLLGSISVVLLALTVDIVMRGVQRLMTPGRRGRGGSA